MPDRKPPPIATTRDFYTVSYTFPLHDDTSSHLQVSPEPDTSFFPTPAGEQKGSFNLIRALGLNADCPCWAWICIIFGILVLVGLLAMCLYFILGMFIVSHRKKTEQTSIVSHRNCRSRRQDLTDHASLPTARTYFFVFIHRERALLVVAD